MAVKPKLEVRQYTGDGKKDYALFRADRPKPICAGITQDHAEHLRIIVGRMEDIPETINEEVIEIAIDKFNEKYEDMTLTPDGEFIIATTGFDRMKGDSSEWDGFNTLMVWPVGKPDEVKVVSPSASGGVTSSVSLRKKISQALITPDFPEGVPYFKVESVAAIPDSKLLFGIRELGVRYDKFVYSFKIVTASYRIEGGELFFTSDFELSYDFDTQSSSQGRQTTALSSIEYDKYHDRLYMLTSYETEESDEGLGGFLWTLPLCDLRDSKAPKLVTKKSGDPLLFAHKAEAVTVLSAGLLLVLHDDDRVLGREIVKNPETQFSRKPHQAAYSLVSVIAAVK